MFLSGIVANALWCVESVFWGPEGAGGGGKKVPVFMTSLEVAEMLKMSPRSIEKMRLDGRGPRYLRLGVNGKAKVIYELDEVLRWLDRFRRG